MKCSESWLREWVNPNLSREELGHILTMGGLEVEEISPAAEEFKGIVIGQVKEVTKHPSAEKLTICKVDVGNNKLLTIVCGASNVKENLKVAVAMLNASLPDGKTISPTEIRGVASEGMLCSASELKISDNNDGILELENDAPVGKDLWAYLDLTDYTIDIGITPNRGDCLSVRGIAREISALSNSPLQPIDLTGITSQINDTFPVSIDNAMGCPRYVGRVIRNVQADAQTPVWLKERLRRSGVRSISPVVDVTNYAMLELGQPMHAFDLEKLNGGIEVRNSRQHEKITLLDASEKELDAETLVIADKVKPLAIAGVMGGLDSGVTLLTKDIFLESAFFAPKTIAKQRQFYHLNSDSAYRFERGVDPTIQREAIERATQLILEICGGKAGPIIEKVSEANLPIAKPIYIPHEKINKVLGIQITEKEIEAIFTKLNFIVRANGKGWDVEVPSYRFDITIAEDLIEEIARLYGYNNIPMHQIKGDLHINKADTHIDMADIRKSLCDLGYHEVISYSFISKQMQSLVDRDQVPRELVNPITADMTVMRTNLWGGLLNTFLYNQSRQQTRIRLFEIGTCFITNDDQLQQPTRIAGLISGSVNPIQWGDKEREVDFFDLKGDIETLLATQGIKKPVFKQSQHPALHPGQTASIYFENNFIGIIGALHPTISQSLDITGKVFLFEFDQSSLDGRFKAQYSEISKFPEIRRDLALLINETIPAQVIQDTIITVAGDWLKETFIFDVYKGKGIPAGLKSIALALILQHPTRTLVDDEVTELTTRVIEALKEKLGAELRS